MRSPFVVNIATTLEVKARAPGGLLAAEAVLRAEQNLEPLRSASLAHLDADLQVLGELIGHHHGRPPPQALLRMQDLAGDMLACCSAVRLPGLADALFGLCQTTHLIQESEAWSPGTLEQQLLAVCIVRALHGPPVTPSPPPMTTGPQESGPRRGRRRSEAPA